MNTTAVTPNTDFINIPIEQIQISESNPRTDFEETKIIELAESIKQTGILQPVIVRLPETQKDGKHFQLVCGERRVNASVRAGLKEIPGYFRNLSDSEAENIQIIENLQREDVHPLDEATAFLKMVDKKTPVKEIGLKIGKTELYIKERLALNGLISEGKTDFRKGTMQLGHAKILCLLMPEQQKRAIQELSFKEDKNKYYQTPKQLQGFLNRRVLLRLADAPFDTESKTLAKKAGACTDCPTQTGANKELFSCLTSDSMCQNEACWELKAKATDARANDKLLKKYGFKKKDCIPVTSSWYHNGGDNVLTSANWKGAAGYNECPTVILGYDKETNRVGMICCNKKCTTHFKPDTHINTDGREVKNRSGIPIDETKAEALKRRMIKRQEKENSQDRNAARKRLADKMLSVESELLNGYEVDKIISIVVWDMMGSIALKKAAELIGYDKELGYFGRDRLLKHISGFSEKDKYMFLRKMLVLKALNDQIGDPEFYKTSDLMQHAKSLKKSITPIYNSIKKKREKTRKENIKEVKNEIKKAQEQDQKYLDFYTGGTSKYLKSVKKLSIDQLNKQPIEKLKKLAKDLGCRRPKEADTRYYAHLLHERMAYLKKRSEEVSKTGQADATKSKAA